MSINVSDFKIDYTYLSNRKLENINNVVLILNNYDINIHILHLKVLKNPPLENYSLYDLIISVVGVGGKIPNELLIDRITEVLNLIKG